MNYEETLNSMDAMEELTTDTLSDPDYSLPIIRTYLNGGGVLSSGWALALVNEIEKLWQEMEINTTEAARTEREHAANLCNAWGHYWAELYTTKLSPHQISTMGWALSEKIKAGETMVPVTEAVARLAAERSKKRRRSA
jgi:hypothetical protein